ncbi:hypothetical protein NYA30BAC_01407 [Halomonas sp. NYA30]
MCHSPIRRWRSWPVGTRQYPRTWNGCSPTRRPASHSPTSPTVGVVPAKKPAWPVFAYMTCAIASPASCLTAAVHFTGVQRLLDHNHVCTTQRYAHLSQETLLSATNGVGLMLSASMGDPASHPSPPVEVTQSLVGCPLSTDPCWKAAPLGAAFGVFSVNHS